MDIREGALPSKDKGELKRNTGAAQDAGGGVDVEAAAVQVGDRVREREAEATTFGARGVEGVEHAAAQLRRDAGAGVADRELELVVRGACFDEQRAVRRDVCCVGDQVAQRLAQLDAVADKGGCVDGDRDVRLAVGGDLRFLDEAGRIDQLALERLGLREREQAGDDRVGFGGALGDQARPARDLFVGVVGEARFQQVGKAGDGVERVADLVGDAAGHRAERGDLVHCVQALGERGEFGAVVDDLHRAEHLFGLLHQRTAQVEA